MLNLACLAVLSLSAAAVQSAALQEERVLATVEWQSLTDIPVGERTLRCRQCNGRYVDPLSAMDRALTPDTSEMSISAETSSMADQTMLFEGDVQLRQGYRQLRADALRIDRSGSHIEAEGHIVLREPGVALSGAVAVLDRDRGDATLEQVEFVAHEAGLSGQAESLQRRPDGQLLITDGAMTFCAPDDPSWLLHAEEVLLSPNAGVGEATDATLQVAGVPVLYLPWIQFPLNDARQSGLLFPDIGSDTRGGLDLTVPIYWNLAPNYDLTYSPRWIQDRGLSHGVQGRLLDSALDYWEFNGQFLSGDDEYRNQNPGANGNRWSAQIQHEGRHGLGWNTQVDFTKVSDVDYIKDLDTQSLSAQRQTALLQYARAEWQGEAWLARFEAQQFQSIAADIREDYKKLPQVTLAYLGQTTATGLQPLAKVQYTRFEGAPDQVQGDRVYAEVGLTYDARSTFGYLKPTLKYRQVSFDLTDDEPLVEKTPSAEAAHFSLDGGLIFERQIDWRQTTLTQTLEPRFYYRYAEQTEQTDLPDFDSAELTFSYQQLYRDTRFAGYDRLDDANQLSLGVTSRFFDNESGREQLSVSLGQIVYFQDREVRLNAVDPVLTDKQSPVATEVAWQPNDRWWLRANALYDYRDNRFDAASLQAIYRQPNGLIVNAGYTLREPPPSLVGRPVTEQANISGYLPIDDSWRFFGAFEYSLEANRSVEEMIGVEYDDCCWRFRVLYMGYVDALANDQFNFQNAPLDREHAIQFQVLLKGMGGFGRRVDNLLRDMIRGFNDVY